MKAKFMKLATMFASFAFMTAFIADGSASMFFMHEPEVPECLK